MVNDRFLLADRYGFERVDAWFSADHGEPRSWGADCGDFFKNGRRIKLTAITCDLSRSAEGPR
jgi:hypothetical protein